MYTKSAAFYDAIYSFKNYPAEAAQLHALISRYKLSPGNRLLDVACGTGMHLRSLRQNGYEAEGLDLEENLIAVARERNPGVRFHCADMTDFELGVRFDVITCLFSAIGYVKTVERLRQTVRNIARHLAPGGVLLVEPWFTPDVPLEPLGSLSVDHPKLKLARIISTQIIGNSYIAHFHYLIGKPGAVEYLVERHELGLFTLAENRSAFEEAGLETTHDPKGLIGRGLWIGVKPQN